MFVFYFSVHSFRAAQNTLKKIVGETGKLFASENSSS